MKETIPQTHRWSAICTNCSAFVFSFLFFFWISPTLASNAPVSEGLSLMAKVTHGQYHKHKAEADRHYDNSIHHNDMLMTNFNAPYFDRMLSYDSRDKAVEAAKINTKIATVYPKVKQKTGKPEWLRQGRQSPLAFYTEEDEHGDLQFYKHSGYNPDHSPNSRATVHSLDSEERDQVDQAMIKGDQRHLRAPQPSPGGHERTRRRREQRRKKSRVNSPPGNNKPPTANPSGTGNQPTESEQPPARSQVPGLGNQPGTGSTKTQRRRNRRKEKKKSNQQPEGSQPPGGDGQPAQTQ